MIDLKAIEDRRAAAIRTVEDTDDHWADGTEECVEMLRTDIPALIARLLELEADKAKLYTSVAALSEEIDTLCERADALGIENAQLRAGIVELQTQSSKRINTLETMWINERAYNNNPMCSPTTEELIELRTVLAISVKRMEEARMPVLNQS